MAVVLAGMWFVVDGVSGRLLPSGLQSISLWKPLSSEVRIFLGLAMIYGALIPFVWHHVRPASRLAGITLLPNIGILVLAGIWPLWVVGYRGLSPLWSFPILTLILLLAVVESRYIRSHKERVG